LSKSWFNWLIYLILKAFICWAISKILNRILINILNSKGIYLFIHIKNLEQHIYSNGYWLNVGDLGLFGSIVLEWDNFISCLYVNGIFLKEGEDSLFWRENIINGQVTTREVYNSLVFSPHEFSIHWHKNYRTGIFHKNWDVLDGSCWRIESLPWIICWKNSFLDFHIYCLCKFDVEIVNHLFVHYSVSNFF